MQEYINKFMLLSCLSVTGSSDWKFYIFLQDD